MRKQMPTPYLIYCTIPVEQYEELIDFQTKLIKEALEARKNKCINALRFRRHSIPQYDAYNHPYYTKEAQEMFITELKRQGYKFVDNDNYIEWDDIFDNEKRKE